MLRTQTYDPMIVVTYVCLLRLQNNDCCTTWRSVHLVTLVAIMYLFSNEQNMTQCKFFREVSFVWIKSFPSSWLFSFTILKTPNSVPFTNIWKDKRRINAFRTCMNVKSNASRCVEDITTKPIQLPTTITVALNALPQSSYTNHIFPCMLAEVFYLILWYLF